MNDLATLARLLENLIRLGTIAEVDVAKARVRVQTGKLLTAWLPWLAPRAGSEREWSPPSVGEQVLLVSPSGQLANGVAITGLFSQHHPANGDRELLHRRTYPDGAVLEYDSAAHLLRATIPGDVEVAATGSITATAGADITLQAGGDVAITAGGNFTVTAARVDLN